MTPSVSVVIPAFQNRGTIGATIESVLAQSFGNFELIVADHSSDDGTLETATSFTSDPRVRVISTPSGGGAVRNWNRVTGEARGTFVKLLCGDDLLYPDCLQTQVEALRKQPTAGMTAVRRDLIDASGKLLLRGRGLGSCDGLVSGREAVRATIRAGTNLFGEPACVLMRTALLRAAGAWRAEQPYLIDQDLYIRILLRSDLVAVRETLAAFRLSDGQLSFHLVAEQSRQAGALHRRLRRDQPEVISSWDCLVGSLQARRTSLMRRAAYLVWSRRLTVGAP